MSRIRKLLVLLAAIVCCMAIGTGGNNRPVWGMWGVNVDGRDNDNLAEMIEAGIEHIALSGWLGDYSPGALNWRIEHARELGVVRVVVPITHGRIQRAGEQEGMEEIRLFIDSVHSGFFYLDEPKYNEEDVEVIKAIGAFVRNKPWPRGLYIPEPVVDQTYDAEYYDEAYRLMPDYYVKSLDWKKETYELLESRKPLAPLLALMYVASEEGPHLPDSLALRKEIDVALPYATEIWFYGRKTSVQDPQMRKPFDLFSPRSRWEVLKSVLDSYQD